MSLFGKLVRTAVNVVSLPVTLPLAVAKDVVTLAGVITDQPKPYVHQLADKIKEEAED